MSMRLPVYRKVQFASDWSVPGRGGAESSVSCSASSNSSLWGDMSGCDDTGSVLGKYSNSCIKVSGIQRLVSPASQINKFKDPRMSVLTFVSISSSAI